jgi:streptomycin 3"-adenylyltransferase
VTDVIDPVPRGDLDRAMRDVVPDLMADLDDDTRNVLLTLARVWFTLETGTIGAKDVAADWASARLPGGGDALRRARAGYLGHAADSWDDEAMAEARTDAGAICDAIGLSSGSDAASGARRRTSP